MSAPNDRGGASQPSHSSTPVQETEIRNQSTGAPVDSTGSRGQPADGASESWRSGSANTAPLERMTDRGLADSDRAPRRGGSQDGRLGLSRWHGGGSGRPQSRDSIQAPNVGEGSQTRPASTLGKHVIHDAMSDTADQPANKRQATRPASTLGRRAANQAMFDAAKQMVDEERATRRASTGGQPSVEEAMFDAATQLVNGTEPTVLRLHRDQVVVIRDSLRVINLTPRDPTLPQTNFMVHGATEPGAIDVKMDPKTKEGWLTKAAAIHYYIDRGRRDVITTVRGVIDEHGTSRGEVIATIREVINM